MSSNDIVTIKNSIINSTIELKRIFINKGIKFKDIEYLMFDSCIIKNVDFSFLSLRELTFKKCDIHICEFINMYLLYLDISCTYFQYCTFHKCNFDYICINTSDIMATTFTKCTYNTYVMNCSRLIGSVLYKVRVREQYINSIESFSGTDLIKTSGFESLPMVCPKEDEFIGWKKCCREVLSNAPFFDGEQKHIDYIVKLLIPKDAKRSSGTGRKCRCSKAKVLGIYDFNHEILSSLTEVFSNHEPGFIYRVGEWVYPDGFDDDRFNECSHGIHFFMSFKEAREY